MGSQPEVNVYSNRDKLSSALAAYVARRAANAAARRGRFCVALSGGSLMDIIGPPLATMPLSAAIDWAAWHIFWADERWVPKDSPDSNYHHADRQLLTHVGIPVEQIHAVDDSFDPAQTAGRYEDVMRHVLEPEPGQWPRLDLILLGIGTDGHTASLFPDHPALRETQRWVVAVMDAPKPPPIRITMTLPVINNAHSVLFVAAGDQKAQILSRVFKPNGKKPRLPSQLVNPSGGELGWFLDRAAAADLF
ncbi:6-phosphogluconolactonase [Desulfobacter latus]|uniref:6-phosphogluconolactonase n=1 Tax=Desulfobacter latus TaxID=2292 RepID=A0A850T710_9BACT|nr:6-phosphogluconolactonase [Desulfobacter latus]NWH05192.1 6-phosphogluconolactonase [Desulfobacter latus]